MKFYICSYCKKIIENNKNSCKTCGECYCDLCKKYCGKSCLICGEK